MNKIVAVAALLQTFFSIQNQSFHLKAHLVDIPDNTSVILVLGKDTIGSAISIKGKFEFKGTVDGGANFYFLYVQKNDKLIHSNALWLENKRMSLTGSFNEFSTLKLEGSRSQEEYEEVLSIGRRASDSSITLYKKFVEQHPQSLYVPNLIIRLVSSYSKEELRSIYENLSDESKGTEYGMKLRLIIQRLTRFHAFYEKGPAGEVIPNFEITDRDGRKDSLYNLLSKGTIVLLDFWASWCKPCRDATSDIKMIYNTYKSKGFEVIGISIDRNKNDWLNAAVEDNLTWMQYHNEKVHSQVFGMKAIPGYILLDNKGQVIMADYMSSPPMVNSGLNEMKLLKQLSKVLEERLK